MVPYTNGLKISNVGVTFQMVWERLSFNIVTVSGSGKSELEPANGIPNGIRENEGSSRTPLVWPTRVKIVAFCFGQDVVLDAGKAGNGSSLVLRAVAMVYEKFIHYCLNSHTRETRPYVFQHCHELKH